MTELDFDRWKHIYAARTSQMRSSEIRSMLAVTQRTDIISFAGGLPDTRVFPNEQIVEATQRAMAELGHVALQYGPSEGHPGFKEILIDLMAQENIPVDHDDFIVTDGGQQALELLAKIFVGEGDTIIVEGPSYVGAIQAFSGFEPSYVLVPLDEYGMNMDILEAELERLKREKITPKFLYTVPNFHNPAGVTMSLERRRRLVKLSREHDFLIIEDNPYGWLRYSGESNATLRSMDENVIYVSTLSKIFSPGMRLGWVVAPRPILEKLIFAKQAADLCTSMFTQRVAEEYFKHAPWRDNLNNLIQIYRGRRDAMLAALEDNMPEGASWTRPDGGLFVWASLPEAIDTGEMLAEAIQKAKVAYISGRAFYPDGSGKNSMRLNFSFCEEGIITAGIERLGEVVKEQVALYESFYGSKAPSRMEE